MSVPPKGHNLKYFLNDESEIIRRATASVSHYGEKLAFNVSGEKKELLKNRLKELIGIEWVTDTYGVWIEVFGIENIKKSLIRLKDDSLISNDFYLYISKQFPKPGRGTVDLLTQSYPSKDLKSNRVSRKSGFFNKIDESKNALTEKSFQTEDKDWVSISDTDVESDVTLDDKCDQVIVLSDSEQEQSDDELDDKEWSAARESSYRIARL